MAKEPTGKELQDAYERMLPSFIESFEKATENFPYPSGKKYRKAAQKYRREMSDAIQAVEKAFKKFEAERAKKKPKKKRG